jgi:hypothetical protein
MENLKEATEFLDEFFNDPVWPTEYKNAWLIVKKELEKSLPKLSDVVDYVFLEPDAQSPRIAVDRAYRFIDGYLNPIKNSKPLNLQIYELIKNKNKCTYDAVIVKLLENQNE